MTNFLLSFSLFGFFSKLLPRNDVLCLAKVWIILFNEMQDLVGDIRLKLAGVHK